MKLGLLAGEGIRSFSPLLFRRLYGLLYEQLSPTDPAHIRAEIANRGWIGFNVTTPYKESVYSLLDTQEEVVEKIHAVNTVAIYPDGRWHGYNTDFEAAKYLLQEWTSVYLPWEAIYILGTGGAARAVAWAHRTVFPEVPICFVSRDSTSLPFFPAPHSLITYEESASHRFPSRVLLVQATPLGMFPHIRSSPPFPLERIQPTWLVWDLVYNPNPTAFLRAARRRGAPIESGLHLFRKQAEYSLAIWTDLWRRAYRSRAS
ncbi:MAG: hypothetical protein N2170_03370 [Bacteroidia bacterium]|nr:hypothetical protein [Bacteroidia bacterium]